MTTMTITVRAIPQGDDRGMDFVRCLRGVLLLNTVLRRHTEASSSCCSPPP